MGVWWSNTQLRELEQVKKERDELRREIDELKQRPPIKLTCVSKEVIEKLADAQMTKANIPWMPDGIERRLKVEMLLLVANMVDHVLETSRVEFMGHEVKLDLIQKSIKFSQMSQAIFVRLF